MERKDVMSKNVAIYKAQASALEKGANPGCKVGHPAGRLSLPRAPPPLCLTVGTGCHGPWAQQPARPAGPWKGMSCSKLSCICRAGRCVPPANAHCAARRALPSLPSAPNPTPRSKLCVPTSCAPVCVVPMQVLVVANPANTNALILKENAPSIPPGEPSGHMELAWVFSPRRISPPALGTRRVPVCAPAVATWVAAPADAPACLPACPQRTSPA